MSTCETIEKNELIRSFICHSFGVHSVFMKRDGYTCCVLSSLVQCAGKQFISFFTAPEEEEEAERSLNVTADCLDFNRRLFVFIVLHFMFIFSCAF